MYTMTYRKPIMIFLTIVGMVMFGGSVFYFLGFQVPVDSPPYFQLVFGFFIVAFIPFSIYRTGKKNFYSHGRLHEKIIYEFTDEEIKQMGETFSLNTGWTKIYKIQERNNWILIYQSRQLFNLIPKESFGDRLPEFKELVRSKGIAAKLRK